MTAVLSAPAALALLGTLHCALRCGPLLVAACSTVHGVGELARVSTAGGQPEAARS